MRKLRYGNTNTYFIDGLLFDTDMPGTMPQFFKAIKQNEISLTDIHYVLASHYHPDHIGLISELMDMGVWLIVVENQMKLVHFADEIIRRQYGSKYSPIDETRAKLISIDGSRRFLKRIALILDDGNCFVGDLEPRSYIDAYEDNRILESDWNRIASRNPKVIHFGHADEQTL